MEEAEITVKSIDDTTYYFFNGVPYEFITEAICACLEEGYQPVIKS